MADKKIGLLLALILCSTFLIECRIATINEAFYMEVKNVQGTLWGKKEVKAMSVLLDAVWKEYTNVTNKQNEKHEKLYIHLIKLFSDTILTNNTNYLNHFPDVIATQTKGMKKETLPVGKKKIFAMLLKNFLTIIGDPQYANFSKDLDSVFVFDKKKDGNFTKYDKEIKALEKLLSENGHQFFFNPGPSPRLEKYVRELIDNRLLKNYVAFKEKCIFTLKQDNTTKKFTDVVIGDKNKAKVKLCRDEYFKKMYDLLNKDDDTVKKELGDYSTVLTVFMGAQLNGTNNG